MSDPGRRDDLGIRRLLWAFAILAPVLLGLLALVPARSYHSEWRTTQDRYNALAQKAGVAPVDVSIKQIWRPKLDAVDRCTSCHLADGRAAPIGDEPLFSAHPKMPHGSEEFGCTVCHRGQGRATTEVAAHGNVAFWDAPMLERPYLQAGCGTCHVFSVPPAGSADKGRELVKSSSCRKCHRLGGKGGDLGPDLTWEGLKQIPADWHDRHVESAMSATEGPWMGAFTPLADDEIAAVAAYLRTLVGAPRLLAGKALAYRLGCLGCHRINRVGGDDGPDLSAEGSKPAGDFDFSFVTGPHTVSTWLRQHFLDPGRVVKGSRMPRLGLTEEQADLLVLYVLSLQDRDIPESLAPPDRVRTLALGERDFATDGETLYGVFCAACHGLGGKGRRFERLPTIFPAIGNLEFLALASDEFLEQTIDRGRPGRRMPAWGNPEGGLRPAEVKAVVGYLRSLEPQPPTFDDVEAAPADVEAGRRLFAEDCKGCHGAAGEGTVLAPPLAAPDNPVTGEESRIYGTLTVGIAGTAMGSFRRFDAASLHSVIAAVRSLPPVDVSRAGWAAKPGDAARGANVYAANCAKCHGKRGEGAEAPSLANPAFLAAASDGYLVATIVRGRGATEMPHFGTPGKDHKLLSPAEVADVVAFLRSLAPPPRPPASGEDAAGKQ